MNTIIDIEQQPSEKAMISRQLAYYKELQKLLKANTTDRLSTDVLTASQDESERYETKIDTLHSSSRT